MQLLIRFLMFLGRHWKAIFVGLGLIAAGKFLPWEFLLQALQTLLRFWWLIVICVAIWVLAKRLLPARERNKASVDKPPRLVSGDATAGLAVRLLRLSLLTPLLIVTGFIFLENQEVKKIIPPSEFVYMAVLLGKCLILCGASYWIAIRGNNFTDWKTEVCVLCSGSLIIVSVLGSHMFPVLVGYERSQFWNPMAQLDPVTSPDYRWLLGLIPAMVLLVFSAIRIYFSHRSAVVAPPERT